jgi:predicted ferric reductase
MKRFLWLILLLNLGVIIGFWSISSGSFLLVEGSNPVSLGNFLLALGRLLGFIGMLFVLFQLILIGRASWVEHRYGHDALAKIHQENGRIALGFLIVHPIFMILGNSWVIGSSFTDGFLNLVQTNPLVVFAPIGLIILFTIVLISNPLIMKRVKYEHWYYFHLFQYSAIALVIGHQFFVSPDFMRIPAFLWYWIALYIFVICNFIIYRVMKPFLVYRQYKFAVNRRIQETHDTVSLYIKGQNISNYIFLPGQFLLMRFLSKRLWWQVHPFSISAIPNGEEVRVTVKAEGDYTKELVQINPGTRVILDGPLGRFTRNASKREKVLFVAAGVGITPIRSVLEDLALLGKNILLIYGNKTSKDIIFQKELEELSKQYNFPILYFLSREKVVPPVNTGRIDLPAIQRLVPDLQEREIFLCGPVEMMRSLRINLAKIGFPSEHVHFEKFNW